MEAYAGKTETVPLGVTVPKVLLASSVRRTLMTANPDLAELEYSVLTGLMISTADAPLILTEKLARTTRA